MISKRTMEVIKEDIYTFMRKTSDNVSEPLPLELTDLTQSDDYQNKLKKYKEDLKNCFGKNYDGTSYDETDVREKYHVNSLPLLLLRTASDFNPTNAIFENKIYYDRETYRILFTAVFFGSIYVVSAETENNDWNVRIKLGVAAIFNFEVGNGSFVCGHTVHPLIVSSFVEILKHCRLHQLESAVPPHVVKKLFDTESIYKVAPQFQDTCPGCRKYNPTNNRSRWSSDYYNCRDSCKLTAATILMITFACRTKKITINERCLNYWVKDSSGKILHGYEEIDCDMSCWNRAVVQHLEEVMPLIKLGDKDFEKNVERLRQNGMDTAPFYENDDECNDQVSTDECNDQVSADDDDDNDDDDNNVVNN